MDELRKALKAMNAYSKDIEYNFIRVKGELRVTNTGFLRLTRDFILVVNRNSKQVRKVSYIVKKQRILPPEYRLPWKEFKVVSKRDVIVKI